MEIKIQSTCCRWHGRREALFESNSMAGCPSSKGSALCVSPLNSSQDSGGLKKTQMCGFRAAGCFSQERQQAVQQSWDPSPLQLRSQDHGLLGPIANIGRRLKSPWTVTHCLCRAGPRKDTEVVTNQSEVLSCAAVLPG